MARRLSPSFVALVVIASVCGGCERRTKPPQRTDPSATSATRADAGAAPAGPDARPAASQIAAPPRRLGATKGEVETIDAVFDIDRIPGGKRFQGSWLELADGTALVVSYRPLPKYFSFIERRVRATGYRYRNPPYVQQIGAPHFRLQKLELAPGVKGITPAPTELPAPPRVNTPAELAKRRGRWVRLVGKLLPLGKKGRFFSEAPLLLSSGVEVHVHERTRDLPALVGKRVTAVGRLMRTSNRPGRVVRRPAMIARFVLRGHVRVCLGDVPRCGMRQRRPAQGLRPKKRAP